MNNDAWMQTAIKAAEGVYTRFMNEVVGAHVVNDREERQLGEKNRKKVEKGDYADPRALRLMCISGKGGYSKDPEKQIRYDKFYNINLLDHLLSVTRGALVFCSMDLMALNPDMDQTFLNRKLVTLVAIAFMHDLDKDLNLLRNTPLELEDVEERMDRYGLKAFLGVADISLSPSQLRYLIEKVEATQAHRHAPDERPPRDFEHLPLYVRLADKLDGAWASSDPERGGLKGVLKCLEDDEGCLHTDILKNWKPVCLFDPHHPFFLDELQRWISLYSRRIAGIPPLVEVHRDGRLFMLLPLKHYDDIVRQALDMFCNRLPFNLRLNVSNRGIPSLYDGNPVHQELIAFIENLGQKDLSDLFKVKQALALKLSEFLDDLLDELGLEPRWPKKTAGALTTLYATFEDMEEFSREWLWRTAHLVLLLNLKITSGTKSTVPDYKAREQELLDLVAVSRPDWINLIEDDASRRIITALWVTAMADQDEDILEQVWGDEGLLKKWLEGEENRQGMNQYITGEGSAILQGVNRYFLQLLGGQRIRVEDENASGRCLFTDEPVPFSKSIDQALGLYGVKVSAFSGRDNRPEMISSDRSHTNVGASSVAEHKFRSQVHQVQGGKDNGVPALISSPTTSGLFGGLGMTDDKAMAAMSIYDLNRLELKKGKVLHGIEMFQRRYRMARFERVPEKLSDQVNMMRMLLNSVPRIGRSLHIFRGLPTPQRAYFYFDAMPRVLSNLVGGNALRLEQIPDALKHLQMAQEIMESPGLGNDVLKRYAMPDTRLGAICLIWCHFREKERSGALIGELYKEYLKHREEQLMSKEDGAWVKLGQMAAGIQKYPGSKASANDELLVFKICMDTLNAVRHVNQNDEKSLIYAIAGELETNLVRKNKAAARKWRDEESLLDACLDIAQFFIKEVWFGTMGGRLPNHSGRRVLSSIYRMAFIQTHRKRIKEKANDK